MSLDNRDFIARHHKMTQDPLARERVRRRMTPTLVIVATAAYVTLFVLIGYMLGVHDKLVIVGLVAFAVSFLAAIAVARVMSLINRNDDERLILRSVMENSSIGRMVTDAKDRTVYINIMFRRMFGERVPSLAAFYDMFSDNPEAPGLLRAMADAAHRGLTEEVELALNQAGEEQFYKITVKPVEDHPGHLHWLLQDVSTQRIRDREVHLEREKLIDFADNAPVGFFSVDEDGRFVFVNATLARWLSQDMNRLMERGRLHDYLVDPPATAAPYDVLPEGGARQVAEIRMKGAKGEVLQAAINMTVVHGEDGRVRTRGVVNDLTAERQMRQALQASEDRFERFFDEAPLGIALIDKTHMIKDCNSSLAHMLGMASKEVEGQNFDIFLDVDNPDETLTMLHGMEQGQPMPPIEVRLKGRRDPVSVQLHARRLRAGDEVVLHFIDLSKQKALEQQFVQSQKMQAIGQLAGGVAHDFNNLLTAMIGFCDLLLLRHKPGDPSFADINQIKQNSNRAANLVRQLLAFSRQQTLRPRVHDITDILIEISHLIRRLMGANVELNLVHGQDLGMVRVDEGQMEQVLINLAVNARDAMPEGGKLSIETRMIHTDAPQQRGAEVMPAGDWVTVTVSDTGTGMPADVMARIFEPFYTTKPIGQGTGLGLSTVYGIMRQTGGFVHVESALFKGTTFTLYLPRVAQADVPVLVAPATAAPAKPEDLTGTARILLVEDEDAVRAFSTRALTNKGYQVLAAASGEEALKVFAESTDKIDLLVTDVVMPNMDGPSMVRQIRTDHPDLKIIFMSGYTEDRLKDDMGPGIFFLPKPFTLKQLAEKVKDVLGT
jgi:two-component system, cell cycle sensor histidine kinase and response regulator CckA